MEEEEDDDDSESDLDDFLVGQYTDDVEDEEYDPSSDRKAKKLRVNTQSKSKRKVRKSRNLKQDRSRESTLGSSDLFAAEDEDDSSDDDDVPISANHQMRRKQAKSKRPTQSTIAPFSNGRSIQKNRRRNMRSELSSSNRMRSRISPMNSASSGSSSKKSYKTSTSNRSSKSSRSSRPNMPNMADHLSELLNPRTNGFSILILIF